MIQAVLAIGVSHAKAETSSNEHRPFFKTFKEEATHHAANYNAGSYRYAGGVSQDMKQNKL